MASRQPGFTLVEMLVVVAILSATAWMALALTGDNEDLQRSQDSERRLAAIVNAVRGFEHAAWGGEQRLSGFVADNGRLPLALRELSNYVQLVDMSELADAGEPSTPTAAGLLHGLRLRTPRFDPQPDSDGWNNGGETNLNAAEEKLPKGLRRYLESRLGSAIYRDGWGNQSANAGDDNLDYGWLLGLPANSSGAWRVRSLGANNALDNLPPAQPRDADIERSVLADDWSLDLAGYSIQVVNRSGTALPAGVWLRASLLVYQNHAGGGRWRRYSTQAITGLADGDTVVLTFPAGGYPGGTLDTRIAQGEHLLLLVSDSDSTAHNGNESPWLSGGNRVSRKLMFFANAARPALELALR